MENLPKKKYSLFTAITMIVGIVIGSGIFFKSDNVLTFTKGNILIGVLLFTVCALSIVFGGLAISELARRTDKPGGVITYMAEFNNKKIAAAFGWFQTFLYYPSLGAIVAWVAGVYIQALFNLGGGLEMQILIGMIAVVFLYVINMLSGKLGGLFQDAATVIKLIPLIVLAVLGLIFGDYSHISLGASSTLGNPTFLMAVSAIPAIAFAFDGWIISTSICHEIKNAKRNLPIALILTPVCILVLYVLYFVGMSIYLGPETIVAMGDDHLYFAVSQLFGDFAGKAIMVFIIISVLGTVNGVVLGGIRLPYALALEGMFPGKKTVGKINKKLDIPVLSGIISFIMSIAFLAIHYFVTKFELLPGFDVSEIAIAISYVLYVVMYVRVIKFYKDKEIKSVWRGIVFPVLAIVGSAIMVLGAVQSSLFIYHIIISVVVCAAGFLYYTISSKKSEQLSK